jgi:hypothetical protein
MTLESGLNISLAIVLDVTSILRPFTTTKTATPPTGKAVPRGSKAMSQAPMKHISYLCGLQSFSAMERTHNKLPFCRKFYLGWIHKAMFRDMRISEHSRNIS